MAIIDFESECWADPWVQQLPKLGKLLFIYLWTNPHRNPSGIYTITLDTIAFESGLTKKEINDLWTIIYPKVRYDPERSICWVVKHARRQFLRGERISPKQRQGLRKHVIKFKWHPFFSQFVDIYPEIFEKEEIKELTKELTDDTLAKGMDTLSMGMDTLSKGPGGGKGGGGGKNLSTTLVVKEAQYSPNPVPEQDSDALRLSTLLFSLIRKRDEKAKEPNLQKWAVHIDRLLKIDQRTPEEIEQIIRWCQEDEFWQNNILSTEKLRDQFTQLILKMGKSARGHPDDAFDKKLAQIKKLREAANEHS